MKRTTEFFKIIYFIYVFGSKNYYQLHLFCFRDLEFENEEVKIIFPNTNCPMDKGEIIDSANEITMNTVSANFLKCT